MCTYSIIKSSFFTGRTGRMIMREGSTIAKFLATYLMTCTAKNMIGLYRLPLPQAAHDMQEPEEAIRCAMIELVDAGFASYDPDSEHVWVRKLVDHQIGSLKPNDNRVKSAHTCYARLDDNPFLEEFFEANREKLLMPEELRRTPEEPGLPVEALIDEGLWDLRNRVIKHNDYNRTLHVRQQQPPLGQNANPPGRSELLERRELQARRHFGSQQAEAAAVSEADPNPAGETADTPAPAHGEGASSDRGIDSSSAPIEKATGAEIESAAAASAETPGARSRQPQ